MAAPCLDPRNLAIKCLALWAPGSGRRSHAPVHKERLFRLCPESRRATNSDMSLSLPQTFLLVAQQRRQQEFDHSTLAGLNLGGHRHAGRQIDEAPIDLHLRTIK